MYQFLHKKNKSRFLLKLIMFQILIFLGAVVSGFSLTKEQADLVNQTIKEQGESLSIEPGKETINFYKHCAYILVMVYKQLDCALAVYDKIPERYPNDPSAILTVYEYKIWALRQSKEFARAIEFAQKEAEKYKEDGRPLTDWNISANPPPLCWEISKTKYALISECYEEMGQYDQAIEQLKNLIGFLQEPDRPCESKFRLQNQKEITVGIQVLYPMRIARIYKIAGNFAEAHQQVIKVKLSLEKIKRDKIPPYLRESLQIIQDKEIPNLIKECEKKM